MTKKVFVVLVALLCAMTMTKGTKMFAATAADTVLINGAGATFPYPIYSKWFDAYHRLFPMIQFNYQSIGSGGGINQVTQGTVDFGATDGPMNDMQLQEYKSKRGMDILHFPTVLGAAVLTYNVAGINQLASVTAAAAAAAKDMPA